MLPRDSWTTTSSPWRVPCSAEPRQNWPTIFALYGALFLREDRPPAKTFEALKRIYRVRSDMVHGTPPKPEDRHQAAKDAADIARAVIRRSLESGWPDTKKLDRMALAPES